MDNDHFCSTLPDMDTAVLKELYSLANTIFALNLEGLFFEEDFFAVTIPNEPTYYVTLGNGVMVANRGNRGVANFLEFLEREDTENELEFFDYQQAMTSLYSVLPFDGDEEPIEQDSEWAKQSGVSFEGTFAPIFRSKNEYCLPTVITEAEAKTLIAIFRSALALIGHLADLKKKHPKHRAIAVWHDEVSGSSTERDFIPHLQVSDSTVKITSLLFEPWEYEITFPTAQFKDAEDRRYYKTMKPKIGKVLYLVTGIFPAPVASEKRGEAVFPVFYLLYDPQDHLIRDMYMLDEYERDYEEFFHRLLNTFDQGLKPQAIHCYGRRTIPLLSTVGPNMGVMILEGQKSDELEGVIDDVLDHFLHSDFSEEDDEH